LSGFQPGLRPADACPRARNYVLARAIQMQNEAMKKPIALVGNIVNVISTAALFDENGRVTKNTGQLWPGKDNPMPGRRRRG
jgi:hypothetical protein